MSKVYVIEKNGLTRNMQRVHCKNEDEELQTLLEKNLDLIPGDQINPEIPRRWLMVTREMPVTDPSTGNDRWSIDLVIGDQDAIPTFVECKRFSDTRSRREVIGQMFEYAANGHHYWDKNQLLEAARKSSAQLGYALEDAIAELSPDNTFDVDSYFELMQENLREGQLRMVFFLEDSPYELRSIVDFLNKQMERTEVLLVEARQYEFNGNRIVVPRLFGYTEEARAVKRTVTVSNASKRKHWDLSSFEAEARQKLSAEEYALVIKMLNTADELGYQVTWGSGNANGSFNLKIAARSDLAMFTVSTSGIVWINLYYFSGELGDRLANVVSDEFELPLEEVVAKKNLKLKVSQLIGKDERIESALERMIS